MAGTYGFSKKLDGVVNLWGRTQSATVLKFPPLGPAGAPAAKRNHFVTVFDLMTYGYNPLFPAYPAAGQTWSATKPSLDFTTYGVTGQSTVIGVQSVTVPAGKFQALVVRSTLIAARVPVRQRHAHLVVRAGQGPRQARLRARRPQRLDRRCSSSRAAMRRARIGVVAVLVVLLAGCGGGGGGHPRRDAVNAYFVRGRQRGGARC